MSELTDFIEAYEAAEATVLDLPSNVSLSMIFDLLRDRDLDRADAAWRGYLMQADGIYQPTTEPGQ